MLRTVFGRKEIDYFMIYYNTLLILLFITISFEKNDKIHLPNGIKINNMFEFYNRLVIIQYQVDYLPNKYLVKNYFARFLVL